MLRRWWMSPVAPTPLDVVTLKDGSVIYGEVVEMDGVTAAYQEPVGGRHRQDEVGQGEHARPHHPIPFHLKEGTVLIGNCRGSKRTGHDATEDGADEGDNQGTNGFGHLDESNHTSTGDLHRHFERRLHTDHRKQPVRNASLLGDFVARSEQLRLSINGRYVYGDNANTAQRPKRAGAPSSSTSSSPSACSGSRPPISKAIRSKISK